MKLLLLPIAAFTSLNAAAIAPDELDSIYTEAIWFVAVFSVMSIISIVISKRQAKKYAEENPVVKNKIEEVSALHTKRIIATDRVDALSKYVESRVLTEEEFQILKQYHLK